MIDRRCVWCRCGSRKSFRFKPVWVPSNAHYSIIGTNTYLTRLAESILGFSSLVLAQKLSRSDKRLATDVECGAMISDIHIGEKETSLDGDRGVRA